MGMNRTENGIFYSSDFVEEQVGTLKALGQREGEKLW